MSESTMAVSAIVFLSVIWVAFLVFWVQEIGRLLTRRKERKEILETPDPWAEAGRALREKRNHQRMLLKEWDVDFQEADPTPPAKVKIPDGRGVPLYGGGFTSDTMIDPARVTAEWLYPDREIIMDQALCEPEPRYYPGRPRYEDSGLSPALLTSYQERAEFLLEARAAATQSRIRADVAQHALFLEKFETDQRNQEA